MAKKTAKKTAKPAKTAKASKSAGSARKPAAKSTAAKVTKKSVKKAAKPAKATTVKASAKKPAKAPKAAKSAKKASKSTSSKRTQPAAAKTAKKTSKKTAPAASKTAKAVTKTAAAKKTKSPASRGRTSRATPKVDVKSSAVSNLRNASKSGAAARSGGSGLSFLSGKPGSEGADDAVLSDKPRLSKTKLGVRELAKFREMLVVKRRQLLGDMEGMEKEALQGEGSNLSHLPVHMADMGTDNYEQEFTLGLVSLERKTVDEIDHALKKIDDKTYGICEGTGQMIAKTRLEAQPWVRYSIEYANQLARRHNRR